MELTLVVADEEILADQAHEDEGDTEPDRGPAPRLVSHHGVGERSPDEGSIEYCRGHGMRYVSSYYIYRTQSIL